MKKITHFAFLAAVALALPFAVQAQRGGAAPAVPAAAPAPRSGVSHVSSGTMPARSHHAAPTAPVVLRGTGTTHHSGGTSSSGTTGNTSTNSNPTVAVFNPDTGTTTFQDFTGQVPGLGFDFAHLAAISGNLAEKALIDPATQAELALAERLNRGAVGGQAFFLSDFGGSAPVYEAPEAPPQPAPQIIIVQPPASAVAPAAPGSAQAQPRVEEEQVAAAPVSEASDFLFVLKSGVMVSAVAFTRQGDQLVYVTREGNRRTLSVATIDSDATTQVNAARGVPLKLSI